MKYPAWPPTGSSNRELGVRIRTAVHLQGDAPLAKDVERVEEIVAGGDSDTVGEWTVLTWLKNGSWFSRIECSYGVSGVMQVGGAFDGVVYPGPIDIELVAENLG